MIASEVRILDLIVSKRLELWPFIYSHVQPSSIDLTLGSIIKIPKDGVTVDPGAEVTDDNYELLSIKGARYALRPGDLVLSQTNERIKIPNDYCCTVANRSSVARLGIDVAMSSYVNPGYGGQLSITIHNRGKFLMNLYPGLRICQLVLHKVEPAPWRDYSQRKDVKYMDESGSLISKLHLDDELRACVAKFGGKKTEPSEFIEALSEYCDALAVRDYEEFRDKLDDSVKKDLGLL